MQGAKMRVNRKSLVGSCIVLLASSVSLAAATGDLRLIEAVKTHNTAAVAALLKQRADVNAPTVFRIIFVAIIHFVLRAGAREG